MTPTKPENFLDLKFCPFRRVRNGRTICTISTDAYVSEIDPLVCWNCEVPDLLSAPKCRFLSLGTEIKPYRGEGKLCVSMACKELKIKIFDLEKTCGVCKLYDEVPNLASYLMGEEKVKVGLSMYIPPAVLENVVNDVRKDYSASEEMSEDKPLLNSIRCWRFEENYCRKFPVWVRNKVTVYLTKTDRNDGLYNRAIKPALSDLNLVPYRIQEELTDAEIGCQICENVQESDYVIFSLDEWSSMALFLTGVAQGLGKRVALLSDRNSQTVRNILEYLQKSRVDYENHGELREKLKEFLSLHARLD